LSSERVKPIATTAAVTLSAASVTSGQSVTATVTVTSTNGTPTGTIQFLVDGVSQGAPQTLGGSGQASLTISAPGVGAHTVTAQFTATGNYADTQGVGVFTVNPIVTGLRVQASPLNSTDGQAVTVTATANAGGTAPAGMVQFTLDGANEGAPIAVSGGVASVSLTGLPAGTHTVGAEFAPSPGANASAASATLAIAVDSAGGTVPVPSTGAGGGSGHLVIGLLLLVSGLVILPLTGRLGRSETR
jgi:hypothetical protein